MCDGDILLVLFEEGLQIEFAVGLIASDSLVVIDLLRFVLVATWVVQAAVLVSRGEQLVPAGLGLGTGG